MTRMDTIVENKFENAQVTIIKDLTESTATPTVTTKRKEAEVVEITKIFPPATPAVETPSKEAKN